MVKNKKNSNTFSLSRHGILKSIKTNNNIFVTIVNNNIFVIILFSIIYLLIVDTNETFNYMNHDG